jgi:hypothetical protein
VTKEKRLFGKPMKKIKREKKIRREMVNDDLREEKRSGAKS